MMSRSECNYKYMSGKGTGHVQPLGHCISHGPRRMEFADQGFSFKLHDQKEARDNLDVELDSFCPHVIQVDERVASSTKQARKERQLRLRDKRNEDEGSHARVSFRFNGDETKHNTAYW